MSVLYFLDDSVPLSAVLPALFSVANHRYICDQLV